MTVRCGFETYQMLRCGSVRFSGIRNITVQLSEEGNPTAHFGVVSRHRKPCGAVWCGFYKVNSHGSIRRGSPCNVFFCGAVPLTVEKTVQHRFFSTEHRMNIPYETTGFVCAFSVGTIETVVSLSPLYGAPYHISTLQNRGFVRF